MKKEYRKKTDSVMASFGAGKMSDDLGYPTPYWRCRVAYTWSKYSQAYWVYSVQVIGFGVVNEQVTQELEMESLREVHRYLGHLKDMEACYQKVYDE